MILSGLNCKVFDNKHTSRINKKQILQIYNILVPKNFGS